MTKETNLLLVHTYFDHINQRNEAGYADLHCDETAIQAPGATDTLSGEAMRAYTQGFIQAFPDLRFDITRTLAEGDQVVVHWVANGTHHGPLAGPKGELVSPTGKSVRVTGTSTLTIHHGKIASGQIVWDRAGLLEQLGLL